MNLLSKCIERFCYTRLFKNIVEKTYTRSRSLSINGGNSLKFIYCRCWYAFCCYSSGTLKINFYGIFMKKIFALAAGLLFSLSASAGYVGYKLDGLYSSYIIQHDDDRSIAMYDIRTPWGAYMPYDDRGYLKGNLMSAWNTFDGYGPTNFTARFDAPRTGYPLFPWYSLRRPYRAFMTTR